MTNGIWEQENIPDNDLLYCYVHKGNIEPRTKIVNPAKAFRNTPHEGGTDLSSDWNKYSTPQETRDRLALQKKKNGENKNPMDYFIGKFKVFDLRHKVDGQVIEHNPLQNVPDVPDNRAHTKIIGDKSKEEVWAKMLSSFSWAIPPDNN